MPRIAEFYGIVIFMYFLDHEPPHIHAVYGEFEASVGISPVSMIRGSLPARARTLVFEWVELHVDELAANWLLARAHQPLNRVPPLD